GIGGRQRVENPHLIGDRGNVDDIGNVGMEALERAFGGLGIECARRDMMRGEIIEQRAGDRRLANAALVRANHDHCRLSHCLFPADPVPPYGAIFPAQQTTIQLRRNRAWAAILQLTESYTGEGLFGSLPAPATTAKPLY